MLKTDAVRDSPSVRTAHCSAAPSPVCKDTRSMREARRDEPTESFGPYVLYECLGRGGMATVHRAKKQGIEGFERPVALKRMLPWLSADADFVKSFVREARLAAQLRHTNIAQVYDLGKVDGAYYIAMELVPGRDLREILRHAHNVSGPPPVSVCINLLFQICDALDYAHTFRDEQGRQLGLVHRDISPANVIVGEDGTAKIVDFGVAKGTTNTLATQSGMLKGKFSYMAPEMLQGQVDSRSDLFAVGIVAWEMMTAKPLFSGGDDMEVLQRIAGWDPPPPSSINPAVSRDVDAWMAMALAKDPRRRFQSAAQMRAGLELVARTPQLRAGVADVAAWVAQAFDDQRPPRRPSAPAPVASPSTQIAAEPGVSPRSATMAVDESSIEVEILRHSTSVGVAPIPMQARSSHTPGAFPSAIPQPLTVPPSGAILAPVVDGGSSSVPSAAASVARTVLLEQSGSGPALGGLPTQMMEVPQHQVPQQHQVPKHQAPLATTQAMRPLPPIPGGGMEIPLSAIAPTISPDAGVVAPHPVHNWQMAPQPVPHQVALHGDDLRSRPEYAAATAAYQAAADFINPVGPAGPFPPQVRGTPQPHDAAAPRRSRPRTAAGPIQSRGSAAGTFVIIVLCVGAAVGGFFLVQHLM